MTQQYLDLITKSLELCKILEGCYNTPIRNTTWQQRREVLDSMAQNLVALINSASELTIEELQRLNLISENCDRLYRHTLEKIWADEDYKELMGSV